MLRRLCQCCALLLLLLSCGVCVDHTVRWTVEGVSNYGPSSPLEVNIGDRILYRCATNSNIIYQPDLEQYDCCDSAKGGGISRSVGECLFIEQGMDIDDIELSIRQASGLGSTVPLTVGGVYYITSYADGLTYGSALTDQTSGGQCVEGLKMVFTIVAITEPPTSPTTPSMVTTTTTSTPPTDGTVGSQSMSTSATTASTSQTSTASSGTTAAVQGGSDSTAQTLGVNNGAGAPHTQLATTVLVTALLCVAVTALLRH